MGYFAIRSFLIHFFFVIALDWFGGFPRLGFLDVFVADQIVDQGGWMTLLGLAIA